jgi:hypothetical protein
VCRRCSSGARRGARARAGAASQFFCGPGNAGGVADGDALSAVTDSTDECVFRDDTLVLLEMTTRDMMEVGLGLG